MVKHLQKFMKEINSNIFGYIFISVWSISDSWFVWCSIDFFFLFHLEGNMFAHSWEDESLKICYYNNGPMNSSWDLVIFMFQICSVENYSVSNVKSIAEH